MPILVVLRIQNRDLFLLATQEVLIKTGNVCTDQCLLCSY